MVRVDGFLTVFRALQTPIAFTFLICICWVEYTEHLGAKNMPSTVLRFLAALLTWPYTGYELLNNMRHRDIAFRGKGLKLLRALIEIILAALWCASLAMGYEYQNTTFGNKNASLNTVAILTSATWVVEIILFLGSLILVLVQTFRSSNYGGYSTYPKEMPLEDSEEDVNKE